MLRRTSWHAGWSAPKAPRLKALAAQINAEFPDLEATIQPGHCNTDRHPKGVRWRIPGKGRDGTLLEVRRRQGPGRPADQMAKPIFRHNSAEPYRYNAEVVRWIEEQREARAGMPPNPPSRFDVTDPRLDAPDGAVVWMETWGRFYERRGRQWHLVEDPK